MLRLQGNGPHFKGCNQGGPLSRRITFVEDKDKDCMNLVEIQDETRKKMIANLEQSLRNEVDVMAAKRMQEESQPQIVK